MNPDTRPALSFVARPLPMLLAAIVVLASGCATTQPASRTMPMSSRSSMSSDAPRMASAILAPASATLVSGKLQLMPMNGGVHVTGEIGGLPPNSTHGIHLHENGDCSAADASSAGGHFNPTRAPHGKADAGAHHAGDMDNIVADAQGVARVEMHVTGVTLGSGSANDVIGRAVVVHASPDDYRSQPAGNSGARVACGVIAASR